MSLADNSDVLQSSQAFVRALKSAPDPVYENGPSKIYIARQGWDSTTLYIPDKATLILEWILTRFHKEKTKKHYENPLVDPAHWTLLADILATTVDNQIVPFITRISIPGILSSILALWPWIQDSDYEYLFPPMLRSLNVLWPLAVQRAGLDSLLECVWTSLPIVDRIFNRPERTEPVDILGLVLSAFLFAFENANAAGKKKTYHALVQHQLLPWLRAFNSSPPTHPLHNQLYSVGTEILLNPDGLRLSLEAPNANPSVNVFSTLFGPSTKSDEDGYDILLPLLPRLTLSYLEALHKHRSTIFTGARAVGERIHHATTHFGTTCLSFLKQLDSIFQAAQVTVSIWHARLGVLTVLETHFSLSGAENDDIGDKMREIGGDAIKILDKAWDSSRSCLVGHALDTLSCLHRIEPAILTPFIPQTLERLATCSATVCHSSGSFLSQLVSYHSKTRTLHTFMSLLLASVTSTFSFFPSSNARVLYDTSTDSHLLSLSFADELADALRIFITPDQADAIVNTVLSGLESLLPQLVFSGEPARKRRRISAGDNAAFIDKDGDQIAGNNIVRFVLVGRLGATILTAVLQNSPAGDTSKQRKKCLDHIDNLISGALERMFKAEKDGTAQPSETGKRKQTTRDPDSDGRWYRECSLAALLRLWYDLYVRSGSPGVEIEGENLWSTPAVLDHLYTDFSGYMHDIGVWPELQLETGRVMYARGASLFRQDNQNTNGWPALDIVLDYIESSLFTNDSNSTPADSNREYITIFTRWETALTLLGLSLERYIFAIDAQASSAQLDRFTEIIIRMATNSSDLGRKQGSSVLARAFNSASFWELCNIRTSLLAVLHKQTAEFASIDVQHLLSVLVHESSKGIKRFRKANPKIMDDIESKISVYQFMHHFPPEYLSRSSRLELARRALVADVLVQILSHQSGDVPSMLEWRTILRSFVVSIAKQAQTKMLVELGSYSDWMPYLVLSKFGHAPQNETLLSATLNLLSILYMSGIRAALSPEGKENNLIHIITWFMKCIPLLESDMQGEYLVRESLLRFINILTHEFNVTAFTPNVSRLLEQLCLNFQKVLDPVVTDLANWNSIHNLFKSAHVIDAWQALLSFKRWLSASQKDYAIGEMILRKSVRLSLTDALDVPTEFREKVLSLLIQEMQLTAEEGCRHISIIVAAYILFTKSATESTSLYDEMVSRASKKLSVVEFGAFLELIAEAMEKHTSTQCEAEQISLVHLSMALLRTPPNSTSKLCREHVTRGLRVFVNKPAFTKGSSILIRHILKFIHLLCIERATSLRTTHVTCIWSLLTRVLKGSVDHDGHTSTSIFQTIVSIVGALIRLRRDLIGPHLPQLAMTLRQLIMVIRGVRSFLGVKQHHLVSDTLPKWISPHEPLGKEEARALARLLTALSVKSLVRRHINDSQTAESLARPFTRHAPYVLLAYLQLMNDPLSVLSITMRRELEPGLFALCGMMKEHGRDTLMVQSLDVGGKALLKSLWKEYEKQKYVGKG